ncbi:MAG TPA: nickel-dependent lactate racemase [Firmicutes bacterium]|nr:nickel-dependent lactate racemase [Bacillota bacterium]
MKTKTVPVTIGSVALELNLPAKTDVLAMKTAQLLSDPAATVAQALKAPIAAPPLERIVREKLREKSDAQAVVVISDNTRPVPYRGESGILWPIVKTLMDCGMESDQILILVANGTHRALSEEELEEMLDPSIFAAGIRVKNHDCRNGEDLVFLGQTSRGSQVYINRDYMRADLKILTGLVESHFMAGVSGGRKSVCPGLIGEQSTYIFHGAPLLASPQADLMILQGNPCHEEALEVAKMAGVDFIVNVTLDCDYNLTGIFAGDLEKAHEKAVEKLREYTTIPIEHEYDLVVTHGGFVGLNHYQTAKTAVSAALAVKPGGKMIIAADITDLDPVGSNNYRTVLHLLTLMGAEKFNKLLLSPDWTFVPDQWQVQMWAKVFQKIDMADLYYYSPQVPARDYQIIPGVNGNKFLPEELWYTGRPETIGLFIENAIRSCLETPGAEEMTIAFLADGPYGVPVNQTEGQGPT